MVSPPNGTGALSPACLWDLAEWNLIIHVNLLHSFSIVEQRFAKFTFCITLQLLQCCLKQLQVPSRNFPKQKSGVCAAGIEGRGHVGFVQGHVMVCLAFLIFFWFYSRSWWRPWVRWVPSADGLHATFTLLSTKWLLPSPRAVGSLTCFVHSGFKKVSYYSIMFSSFTFSYSVFFFPLLNCFLVRITPGESDISPVCFSPSVRARWVRFLVSCTHQPVMVHQECCSFLFSKLTGVNCQLELVWWSGKLVELSKEGIYQAADWNNLEKKWL